MASFITGVNSRQYLHQGLLYNPEFISAILVGKSNERLSLVFEIRVLNTMAAEVIDGGQFCRFTCKTNDVVGKEFVVTHLDIIEDVKDCLNRKYGAEGDGVHLMNQPLPAGSSLLFRVTMECDVIDITKSATITIVNENRNSIILPTICVLSINGKIMIRKCRTVTGVGLKASWSFKRCDFDSRLKIVEYSKVNIASNANSSDIHLPGPFMRDGRVAHIHGTINCVDKRLSISFIDNKITVRNGGLRSSDKLKIPSSSFFTA